ncbi:MAG: MBL fold metallo-hydrolase [Verrucomicrobiales bacterium]
MSGNIQQPVVPLEDLYEDVLGKAMRGLGISVEVLAARSGVAREAIATVLEGEFDAEVVAALAPVLNLNASSLVAMGKKQWQPQTPAIDGVAMFNTPYPGMTVNAYLIWDPKSKDAFLFDTGTDARAMLEMINNAQLKARAIFLTHTHRDHMMDLERLHQALPDVPVYVGRKEPVDGAMPVDDQQQFVFGDISIEARLTSGHSIGGISYIVTGLDRPVAVVGDALFASSMGGGMISWTDALANNRSKLFTLPDDTVVCPGHGPMTSIGEEKEHNPCYPEFKM